MNAEPTIANLPTVVSGAEPKALVPVSFEGVWRMAQIIAASGMAPKDMKQPEQIAVAIMHGMEVGLTPMAALQSIAVINGRPSIWGDGALALIQASGLLLEIEEFEEDRDGIPTAVCRVKRKGERAAIERTFSEAQQKLAGLLGKDIHKQYPQRMRQMRARAFALRDKFADVLRGLAIGEEMRDVDAAVVDMPPPVPSTPPPVASETAASHNVQGAASDAGRTESPPQPSLPASKSPGPDEEVFDEKEFLELFEGICKSIATEKALDDTKLTYAEDIDSLTRSGREKAEHFLEQVESRIVRKSAAKATKADSKKQAPAPQKTKESRQTPGTKAFREAMEEDRHDEAMAEEIDMDEADFREVDELDAPSPGEEIQIDPFDIPTFIDIPQYDAWIDAQCQVTKNRDQAVKLRENWADTSATRQRKPHDGGLGMDLSHRNRLKDKVTEVLRRYGA